MTETREDGEKFTAAKVFSFFSLLMVLAILSLSFLISNIYEIFLDVQMNGTSGDPKLMAGQISQALVLPLQTLFLVFPGWLSAMGVLIFSKFSSRFFFWFWVVCGFVLFINVPFGVLFGLILLILLFFKRKRFLARP
jgi:hypothetical protein